MSSAPSPMPRSGETTSKPVRVVAAAKAAALSVVSVVADLARKLEVAEAKLME